MSHTASQLPSAQKAADDPSTAGAGALDDAPAYLQATGPLYLRAASAAVPLPSHLYTRGFLQGRHSDITVVAFGARYKLHRLILDRAPFFTSALSEPWIESRAKEISLFPDKIDSSITQAAFELAIKKLYGYDISNECDAEAVGLFATGCWLELQDLVGTAVESILRQMAPSNLAPLIRLVTCNYYGRPGDRILESAKAMLGRCGWEMPLKHWDGMPGDIVRELVASDGFFVHSEWDRWVLAKRILDRRLRQTAIETGILETGQRPIPKAPDSLRLMAVRFDAVYRQNSVRVSSGASDIHSPWLALYTSPDVEPILVLLDEGIHYVHMEYEQLDYLRTARDVFGLPVLPEKVISDALWQQLALRQKVLTADESSQILGLCQNLPDPTAPAKESTKEKQTLTVPDDDAESDMDSESWDGNGKPRKFFIPSSDCNILLLLKMKGITGNRGNGADPVVTTSNSFQRHANRLSATIQPEDAQWATDFASSPSTMANPNVRTDPSRPVSAGGTNAGQPKPLAYTEFPPFRFSAEFPNPRHLKEKKRVYSRTVSYAGSLWNIYIQKVRTAKNVQLGVYLHRAKERDTEDNFSNSGISPQNVGSVDERIGQLEREMLLRTGRERYRRGLFALSQQVEDDASGSGSDPDGPFASTEALSSPVPRWTMGSPSPETQAERLSSMTLGPTSDTLGFDDSDADEPASAYPNPVLSLGRSAVRRTHPCSSVLPPYVDRRPTIKTYFKIYSPGKGGRSLSIYESAPDRFNFSQSWGWKSSTLMLDDGSMLNNEGKGVEDEAGKDATRDSSETAADGERGKNEREGNLRFMIVIGNL